MTIAEFAAQYPAVDGRISLSLKPVSPYDPAGERWLVPELTDFGTTVYTYCEENTDCIVEDLTGDVGIVELRVRMAQEKLKYPNWNPETEDTKINMGEPLDNGGSPGYSKGVDDEVDL